MCELIVFNHVSLDGYFVDSKGDMSWAHKQDAEWNAFVESAQCMRDCDWTRTRPSRPALPAAASSSLGALSC